MRPLSRIALLGTLAALVTAPGAMAANSATATVSPNKGGTVTVGAPVRFKVNLDTPDTVSDPSGNFRLLAIQAKLPVPLLFNTIPFEQCSATTFVASKTCKSSTKLGTATIIADGGPDIGLITAKTDLYFGTGFTVLARVQTDKPAILDEAIIGSLRSSQTTGYGLEMYIPIPKILQEPLTGIFPSVKSVKADFAPPTKSIRVAGKKVKLPLAGLGPCPSSKKLNFLVNVLYTDSTNASVTKTDGAPAVGKCKN